MTNPPLISDDLRRQADQFIELASLEKIIGREQGARRVRSKTTETS
jgi:uncharacterized LabA/DUF88 family protein